MFMQNGLVINNDGFRSFDPLTGELDIAVWTKGRTNPKTGKWVKPSLIFPDSLTSFDDMPKNAYTLMSEADLYVTKLFRSGRGDETEGYTSSLAFFRDFYTRQLSI